jgi:hypothetical protein
MNYTFDGNLVTLHFSEGGSIEFQTSPETAGDSAPVSTTDNNGNVYTNFDNKGRPGHVVFATGGSADYTYLPDGRIHIRFDSGENVELPSPVAPVSV